MQQLKSQAMNCTDHELLGLWHWCSDIMNQLFPHCSEHLGWNLEPFFLMETIRDDTDFPLPAGNISCCGRKEPGMWKGICSDSLSWARMALPAFFTRMACLHAWRVNKQGTCTPCRAPACGWRCADGSPCFCRGALARDSLGLLSQ